MGEYPLQHSWGTLALNQSASFNSSLIHQQKDFIPKKFIDLIDKFLFPQSAGFNFEFKLLKDLDNFDLIYSVCGPLSSTKFLRNTKVVSWVFRPPIIKPINPFNPYTYSNLRRHSAFLCLTPKAEKFYSQFAPSRFIPWCVDQKLFNGKTSKTNSPFFLACGKTGRDYPTLIKAAIHVKAEIRIIGPINQKPRNLPKNVNWVDTSTDPPDQAINYSTLRNWYAKCIAVCIPLSGDADDTCGYTNMLEAMAMRKPVLMTKSGCLHIDPESGYFGRLIQPKNPQDWACAMNQLIVDEQSALELGENGRRIAEKDFTVDRFNQDIVSFIKETLNAT